MYSDPTPTTSSTVVPRTPSTCSAFAPPPTSRAGAVDVAPYTTASVDAIRCDPGEAKTDARDAAVIADAARTMPHTLRSLNLTDEVTAELTVPVGSDQDLAGEANRTGNRIRGLLTQFHPSLERVLGPRLDHPAITCLFERHGSPQTLRKAGRRKLVEVVRPRAPRMAERLVDDIFTALGQQTVVVPGTNTLDVIVPSPAKSPAAVHEQRRAPETRIEALLEAHPLSQVLTSIPGIGVRTAAILLATVGDGSSFPSAAHPASYAGLAPATRQSGTSIHGEHAPRGGNRQLKRAMFLSAFAALRDPASRGHYARCRARGKTHTQSLLRLARHRVSVLFTMLRDGAFHEPRTQRLA
nr:IS110 family transposase [Streptomyces sp. WELS2]